MATVAHGFSTPLLNPTTDVRTEVPKLWNPETRFTLMPTAHDRRVGGPSMSVQQKQEPSNQFIITESLLENAAYQTLIQAIEKIAGYAELPDDWDSYGGVGLTGQARDRAQDFVLRLFEADLLDTSKGVDILPVPTGGIQFEWSGPGGAIEVEIDQHGDLHSLIERDDGAYEASPREKPVRWPAVRDQIRRVVG